MEIKEKIKNDKILATKNRDFEKKTFLSLILSEIELNEKREIKIFDDGDVIKILN